MWLIILSDQLTIYGLVSHYLTNYLMVRGLILKRITPLASSPEEVVVLCGISAPFGTLSPTQGQITHVLLTRAPLYSHPKVLSRSTCMC